MSVSVNKDFATVRTLCIGVLVGLVLYIALVIVPFFVYELHVQNTTAIVLYDSNPLGASIGFIGMISTIVTRILLPAAALLVLISSAHGWRQFTLMQRRFSIGLVLFLSLWVAFTLSPIGASLTNWHAELIK